MEKKEIIEAIDSIVKVIYIVKELNDELSQQIVESAKKKILDLITLL